MRYIILYILCVSIGVISSCTTDKTHSNNSTKVSSLEADSLLVSQITNSYYNKVFIDSDSNSVLRGLFLGNTKKEIKSMESDRAELIQENDSHLNYEVILSKDSNGIDYAEIQYSVNNDKLDIITVNYFIKDSLKVKKMSDQIQTQFEKKYGHYYIDSEGYTVWEITYFDEDSVQQKYDIGVKELLRINDPGITIEYAKY